jgi:chaperonin GroES
MAGGRGGGTRRLAQEMMAKAQADAKDFKEFYDAAAGDGLPGDYNEDASLTVEMILAWQGNVAELLDDNVLDRIGKQVVSEYELDKSSRQDWEDMAQEALKLATQKKPETKNTPYPGASNVKYPLLTQACIQFAARAAPALMRGDEVVDAKINGQDQDGEKLKRANRTSAFANHQLMYQCTEWEPGTDTLLHALPAIGHGFRKVYWDATLGRVRLDFVSAMDVVVACDAPSLELAPRITHVLKKYPYEVERLTRGEQPIWRPHDYSKDPGDSQKPCEYLEQCRYEDLDDDGLSEPYIVTVHKDSGEVVRIDPAYDVEDVQVTPRESETGEQYPQVISIKRLLPWVDYMFLPDPCGGYYGMGFGQLLAPISAVIDTTINELIDAGHLANTNTGFLGSQVKTRSGELTLHPNKFKVLPGASNVREAIHRMEFPGPNQTLFALLEFLITTAKDITSVKDVLTGEAPGTQPATSTLALIEQGLQVFSAIYKRVYRAETREFELLYRLNARYLSVEEYNRFLDAQPPMPEVNPQAGSGLPTPESAPQAGNQPPLAGGAPPASAQAPMGQVVPFPTPQGAGSQQPGAGGLPPGVTPPPGDPAAAGFGNPSVGQPPFNPEMGGAVPPMSPALPPMQGMGALQGALPQPAPQYDPAQDFDLSDLDVRPVADPNAVTETQRLAKINFLLQFLGNPNVDQAEIVKRAMEDSRMVEPEKLMAKPNPLMDAQAQAQVNQVQGEARKVHAEASLLEAQAMGAQAEPALRQAEMGLKQQEMVGKQADAQAKAAEAQMRQAELAFREREVALAEHAAMLAERKCNYEERQISLEEARHMLEEHRTALDEAERGEKLALEHKKCDIEYERTTLERIKVLGEQKLGKDATVNELRKILADAEAKKADREQAKQEGDKDRKLEEKKMEHDVKLKEKDIEAKKEVAEHNNKLKAEVAKVAARNKPKPKPGA